MSTPALQVRPCQAADVAMCASLEAASYPADEAASLDTLQYRYDNAPLYFMIATTDDSNSSDSIAGFVCGTRCNAFTHESVYLHHPRGSILAIHSVVVAEPYRRRCLASQMVREYISSVVQGRLGSVATESVAMDPPPTTLELLSKQHLLSFYVNCGFQVMRQSAITHGSEQWYDLKLDVRAAVEPIVDQTYYVVDAFADPNVPGSGNPAAVVPLRCEPTDVGWMQRVAQEFNLSETAFVWPCDGGHSGGSGSDSDATIHYGIRYFTPTVQVDLCGHATLASAAVLVSQSSAPASSIVFHAPKDVLRASSAPQSSNNVETDSLRTQITMTFPSMPVRELVLDGQVLQVQSVLRIALNIDESDILYMGLVPDLGDVFIEVSHDCFQSMGYGDALNISALTAFDGHSRGWIVCCVAVDHASSDVPAKFDFCSRFFAPKAGILEDPVTGSAHCALAPYFATKLQKTRIVGWQASARGGVVACEVEPKVGTPCISVNMTGMAVQTMRGTLFL